MTISVLLADDHKIMRDGLRSILEQHPKFTVAGEAENGRKAVQMALEKNPDVVVMDVSMPDLNGIEATRQILEARPATRVIALSMHSDKRFVVGMLKAGAAGYLLKDCAAQELALAITTVAAGKTYLSPDIAGVMVEDYLDRFTATEPSAATLLTGREREVLQLIAEGRPTREIATRLFVSIKTVETHRSQIMRKLDIHTVADLTKYAIREGITTL